VRPLLILRSFAIIAGAQYLSGLLVWPVWALVRPRVLPMSRLQIFPTEVVSWSAVVAAIVAGAIAGLVAALCLDREIGREWALITAAFVAVMAAQSFGWRHPTVPPIEIMLPWAMKVVLSGASAACAFLLTRGRTVALGTGQRGALPGAAP
jgi:hypothetical protein